MSESTSTYSNAPLWRRGAAYILDCLIAVFPAAVVMFVFTGALWHPSYPLTPFPVTGAVILALDLPADVNTALNTEDGIYLFRDKNPDPNLVISSHEEYNVGILATACRMGSVLCVLFYAGYTVLCTVLFDGKTIGKKLLHIRAVPREDVPKPWKPLLIREALGKAVLNSLGVPVLISLVTVLATKEHLALHDMIAKTKVTEA